MISKEDVRKVIISLKKNTTNADQLIDELLNKVNLEEWIDFEKFLEIVYEMEKHIV